MRMSTKDVTTWIGIVAALVGVGVSWGRTSEHLTRLDRDVDALTVAQKAGAEKGAATREQVHDLAVAVAQRFTTGDRVDADLESAVGLLSAVLDAPRPATTAPAHATLAKTLAKLQARRANLRVQDPLRDFRAAWSGPDPQLLPAPTVAHDR